MNLLPTFFNSKSRALVLQLLFGRHDRSMYLNEMVHVTGMASRSIEIEVKNLLKLGLLKSSRDRSRIYYSADASHLAYHALKALVAAATGPLDLLQEALASSEIEFAFMPGEDLALIADPARDLPLVVLVQNHSRNIDRIVAEASELVGRRIAAKILTMDGARHALHLRQQEVVELFRSAKTFVVGRADRLEERVFIADNDLVSPPVSFSP